LSDVGKSAQLAERLLPHVKRPAHFTSLINFYIRQGDVPKVNSIIQQGVLEGKYWDDESYYSLLAARLAKVNGRTDLMDFFARRALDLYKEKSNRTAARCYSLIGELEKARNIYVQEMIRRPDHKALIGELGVIYAREGNTLKADEMINRLTEMKTEYDFGETPYLQGRIKANMGDPEAAIRLLQQALDGGIGFRVATTFQQDPDLLVLNKEPEYIRLLGSRRHTW
jgi:tetratricopeptide (TPR) repeat protein